MCYTRGRRRVVFDAAIDALKFGFIEPISLEIEEFVAQSSAQHEPDECDMLRGSKRREKHCFVASYNVSRC